MLAIENVSFNYPGGKELYSKVDFGVDLQTRVALVGPNGGVFLLTTMVFIIFIQTQSDTSISYICVSIQQ